jgi:hypothetical protein
VINGDGLRAKTWDDAQSQLKGRVKTAHDHGTIYVPVNKSHGIEPAKEPIIFNTWDEMLGAIEVALKEHNVHLVKSSNRKPA